MSEFAGSRSHLLSRKADLLAALRHLEQDHDDGVVDEDAYRATRHRFEHEAAEVLERLDGLEKETSSEVGRVDATGMADRSRWLLVGGAGVLVVAAIVFFLVTALHNRAPNGTVTGDAGQTTATPPPSPRLVAAQQQARAHPRSVDALVNLGNAYLGDGQVVPADESYLQAMKLDPNAPQPRTLHAMVLGYAGQAQRALLLLHQVEHLHPTYSRAWLLDGVFSARGPKGYVHAIAAWRRFLMLEPHSTFTKQVHNWIAAAQKAQRARR